MGEGTITIHETQRRRSRWKRCKQTFRERRGTMFFGRRKPISLIVIVVTLLASGCPVQAIVQAFPLDERTVADWRDRAGQHGQQIHEAMGEHGHLDLIHVQADDIRVKGRTMVAWMGLAMMVSTRRWLAGTVSLSRDTGLADALLRQVRRTAKSVRPLLVLTDGWSASPGSIRRAFRENVTLTPGPGRACLRVWPDLHSGTVITRMETKRVGEMTRSMAHGVMERAEQVLGSSRGGAVLPPALIERVHGTFRERLASVTRTSRHAASRVRALHTGMDLRGCASTVCVAHQERSKENHWGKLCTPAMASGLTDHVWSLQAVLSSTITPAPWVEPKRRGPRPKQAVERAGSVTNPRRFSRVRPFLRLRKGVLCPTTGSCGFTFQHNTCSFLCLSKEHAILF